MAPNPHMYRVSALAGALILCSTFSISGQIGQRRSDTAVIVDGRVHRVFRADNEYLVQILVQRCEVPRLDEKMGSARFPAPGEYIYAHVEQPDGRDARRSSLLPEPQMYIRAYLSIGQRHRWEGGTPGWFEQVPEIDVTGGRRPDAPGESTQSLGIRAERVSLGFRNALKVTEVEPASVAAQAGIELGDILVKANGVALKSPEQLSAEFRNGNGTLTLTVRDVRTGRDVPVVIESAPSASRPSAVTRERVPGSKRLGVTTELAFYDGEAVVKVTEVEKDSPADRAGIRAGLLILKANGNRILHPDKLVEAERGARGNLRLQVVDPQDRQERVVEVDLP